MFTLVGCVPSSPEKAIRKLEEAGYEVDGSYDSFYNDIYDVEGINYVLNAYKDSRNSLTIIYFDNASQAKDGFDNIMEHAKLQITKIYFEQKGKCVYFGTKTAMKDFEK